MSGEQMLDYRPADPPVSKLAMVSLALSVLGALGCFLVVPPLLAWIWALIVKSRLKQRSAVSGLGLARASVHVSGWSVPLGVLIVILMPCNCGSRELSNRSVCAANLRGIMQSLNVYAADNQGSFPVISAKGRYALSEAGRGTPAASDVETVRSIYAASDASVTQNMWLLVLSGQVAPKQFICKSDPAAVVVASQTNAAGFYLTNFNDGNGNTTDMAYSYSFAYPWETKAGASVGSWWKNQTDASLPLIADMAPYVGTGVPAATPADPTSRNANSFNHQRDGQNVGYGDGHVEFARRPDSGQDSDNIYTFNAGTPSAMGLPHNGTAPGIGNGGRPGHYDICMVPAADGGTFARR